MTKEPSKNPLVILVSTIAHERETKMAGAAGVGGSDFTEGVAFSSRMRKSIPTIYDQAFSFI